MPRLPPLAFPQRFPGRDRDAPDPPAFPLPFGITLYHFRYHLTPQGCLAPMSPSDSKLPHDISTQWSTGILGGLLLVTFLSAPVTSSQRQLGKLCHELSCKGYCLPLPIPAPHINCAMFCPHCLHRVASVCYHLGLCVVIHIGTVNDPGICGSHCRPVRQKWEVFALFRT